MCPQLRNVRRHTRWTRSATPQVWRTAIGLEWQTFAIYKRTASLIDSRPCDDNDDNDDGDCGPWSAESNEVVVD